MDLSARKDENGTKLGKLSGFIPKELHTLENLKYLYLSGNDLIISIPTEFAKLEKASLNILSRRYKNKSNTLTLHTA